MRGFAFGSRVQPLWIPACAGMKGGAYRPHRQESSHTSNAALLFRSSSRTLSNGRTHDADRWLSVSKTTRYC